MPGFFLHMAEAKQIIQLIQDNASLFKFTSYPQWKNDFMLGSVLPDASTKETKYIPHFWNPDHFDRITIAPDLTLFEKKYPEWYTNPLQAGYYCHLHLDYIYFTTYLNQYVTFKNKNHTQEVLLADTTYAELNQTGQQLSLTELFSSEYFYGDYIRMNHYFIEKYQLSLPVRNINSWTIDETTLEHYHTLCRAASKELINPFKSTPMKIFSRENFEIFLNETATSYLKILINQTDCEL